MRLAAKKIWHWPVVAIAAIVMGAPFLGGGFVGGDDHHLLLNHVLVNHPSIEHALKLFSIVHRDLYQPIPLLTFTAEFAVAQAWGLFEHGEEGAAWLFHLTNILLHAINAALAYWVIRGLTNGISARLPRRESDAETRFHSAALGEDRGLGVATVAALLFAVHPLQVEVVAWLNGRMMLLSTLFALLAVLACFRWLRGGSLPWCLATVLFTTLCMMSKVRAGVPVMLIIAAWTVHGKAGDLLRVRFLLPWLICAGITGLFIAINWASTAESELFALATENLQGPRVVRVLRSLAWYVQHFLWPVGLASWYPAPPVVQWSDTETLSSILIVALAGTGVTWAGYRSVAIRLGAMWFLATLADTLPFVPARNIIAADRYMYLPIIGLVWIVGELVQMPRWSMVSMRLPAWSRRHTFLKRLIGTFSMALLIGVCWHTGSYYSTTVSKTERIAQLFPLMPHAWARLGWAYHKEGIAADAAGRPIDAKESYGKALKFAERELELKNPHGWGEAYQVQGATRLRLGDADGALLSLQKAFELNPADAESHYWLGWALSELGRIHEAVPHYEAALDIADRHMPTILKLARLYREVNRRHDAWRMYERALQVNPYEVSAILGIAELTLEEGSPEALRTIEHRLLELLGWMPENDAARISLGAVLQRLGRTSEAMQSYQSVLARTPNHVTAALNLGQIILAGGDSSRARPYFERAAAGGAETVEQAAALEEFFLAENDRSAAANVWTVFLRRYPQSIQGRIRAAWCGAKLGDSAQVEALLQSLQNQPAAAKHTMAIRVYEGLRDGRMAEAIAQTAELIRVTAQGDDARRSLLQNLEYFDRHFPNVPWTFGVAAHLLLAEGRTEEARVFVDLGRQHCRQPDCREYLDSLRFP